MCTCYKDLCSATNMNGDYYTNDNTISKRNKKMITTPWDYSQDTRSSPFDYYYSLVQNNYNPNHRSFFSSDPSSIVMKGKEYDICSSPSNSSITTTTSNSNNDNYVSDWKRESMDVREEEDSTITLMTNNNHSEEKKEQQQNEIDIERIIQGKDNRTTFMIRNIPNKYTQVLVWTIYIIIHITYILQTIQIANVD
jgi:hypothetical protein